MTNVGERDTGCLTDELPIVAYVLVRGCQSKCTQCCRNQCTTLQLDGKTTSTIGFFNGLVSHRYGGTARFQRNIYPTATSSS